MTRSSHFANFEIAPRTLAGGPTGSKLEHLHPGIACFNVLLGTFFVPAGINVHPIIAKSLKTFPMRTPMLAALLLLLFFSCNQTNSRDNASAPVVANPAAADSATGTARSSRPPTSASRQSLSPGSQIAFTALSMTTAAISHRRSNHNLPCGSTIPSPSKFPSTASTNSFSRYRRTATSFRIRRLPPRTSAWK
jgi:hypothetical protein